MSVKNFPDKTIVQLLESITRSLKHIYLIDEIFEDKHQKNEKLKSQFIQRERSRIKKLENELFKKLEADER
jgi:hypothetical protein